MPVIAESLNASLFNFTSAVSPICGKYCFNPFIYSPSDIAAPDSFLNTAAIKFLEA